MQQECVSCLVSISFYGTYTQAQPSLHACGSFGLLDNIHLVSGLVDAHTHPVWAGDRVHEFAMKVQHHDQYVFPLTSTTASK